MNVSKIDSSSIAVDVPINTSLSAPSKNLKRKFKEVDNKHLLKIIEYVGLASTHPLFLVSHDVSKRLTPSFFHSLSTNPQSEEFSYEETTTAALRYPHLIPELLKIKAKEQQNPHVEVLILGPGLMEPGKKAKFFCSPQLHEILAAFHRKAKVSVVDIDNYIKKIAYSIFDEIPKTSAISVLKLGSAKKLSEDEIRGIVKYLDEIPVMITQELDIYQKDFSEFVPKKYDYIFALQSLMYALYEIQHNRPKACALISKYLHALKDNGSLIIDEQLYAMMRYQLKTMPHPAELAENSRRWIYDAEGKSMIFQLEKYLPVPNSMVGNEGEKIVKFYDADHQCMESTNTDLFVIRLLPNDN